MFLFKRIILVLILIMPVSSISMAEVDNGWIVGVWKLQGEVKEEYMEFTEDMDVTLISGKGRKISGGYKLVDNKVKIIYKFKGKKIPIELTYPGSKDALNSKLAKTGKTVEYVKQ